MGDRKQQKVTKVHDVRKLMVETAMTSTNRYQKHSVLLGARSQIRLRAPALSIKTLFSVYLFPAHLYSFNTPKCQGFQDRDL